MFICDCVSESKELKSGFSVRVGEEEDDWRIDDVEVLGVFPPVDIHDDKNRESINIEIYLFILKFQSIQNSNPKIQTLEVC